MKLLKGHLHYHVVWKGKQPDWQDFIGIITLLFIDSTISCIEENNGGNVAACLALKAHARYMNLDRS